MKALKRDEGIAAVVAVMLILAVIITCMTLYTTVYVPQMKQAAEIEHSNDVQLAFERFAADADALYALGKNATYSQVVELGGGDVLLSAVKSSGTLKVENQTIGRIEIGSLPPVTLNTTIVTYQPSYSSWELQGYRYENGTTWITKGMKKTPALLSLVNATQGKQEEADWVNKTVTAMNQTTVIGGKNVTKVVTMEADPLHSVVTGTGIGRLTLDAKITEIIPVTDGDDITIYANGTAVGTFKAENHEIHVLTVRVSAE